MLNKLSKVLGLGVVCIYFIVVFYTSFVVSATCLQDPDTCWLLSMGREIVTTRQVPSKDPYSYTIEWNRNRGIEPESHFVPYQWMSEVTLFGVYRFCEKFLNGEDYSIGDSNIEAKTKERLGKHLPNMKEVTADFGLLDISLAGLLSLTTVILVSSFLLLPVVWISKANQDKIIVSLVFATMAINAASFHFFLRPEVFSFFFLALFLAGLNYLRHVYAAKSKHEFAELRWFLLFSFFTVLAWANFHSGFVIAFILIILLCLLELSKKLFLKDTDITLLKVLALSVPLCFLASLINPFGIGLWEYLPHLFFSKSNLLIEELKPLNWRDALGPSFFPFVSFSIFTSFYLIFSGVKCDAEKRGHFVRGLVIILASILIGFSVRRLIPFTAMVMLFEVLLVSANTNSLVNLGDKISNLVNSVDLFLGQICGRRSLVIWVTVFVSVLVSFWEASLYVPRLPQLSFGFNAPFEGLSFIEKNPPEGNLFNDPQFGDLMIWHLRPAPKVFIDTRFDVYGSKIVYDSWKIENCQENWKELLSDYQIEWIFVPTNTRLAVELESSPEWVSAFRNSTSIVLVKKEGSGGEGTSSSDSQYIEPAKSSSN